MSPVDVAQYANVIRRVGLVLLSLTSLVVAAGIVAAAHRGSLFRGPTGWGAVNLTFWMSFYWWYSLRRSARTPIALWIILPLLTLSASLWLMALAGW